jgi:hypothetical protein
MRSKSAAILLSIGLIMSGGVGLAVGYLKGAEDWAGYTAAADAATTVTKLRALRENKPEVVTRALEVELDAHIARRCIYESGMRPVKYFSGDSQTDSKLLRDVADYRRSNPSISKDETVRRQVRECLKRY